MKTGDAIAAAAVAAPTAGGKDEESDSRVTAPAIGVPPHSLGGGDAVIPTLDIALVGQAGDTVIAGTAAPGATVELLRNSEPLARAVANQFGQSPWTLPTSSRALRTDVEVNAAEWQASRIPKERCGCSPMSQMDDEHHRSCISSALCKAASQ